jgi:hypothetical protein
VLCLFGLMAGTAHAEQWFMVQSAAHSAQSERRFHAIVNARGASAAAAADLGSNVHDEIDNVLGFAANAKYLCPGLAEGRAGAVSEGIPLGACRARQQIRLDRRHTAKRGTTTHLGTCL